MIYKRVAVRLRAQDWVAITIEFAIVVAGVFVGTWVANLNQEQAQARETRRLLIQVKPDLQEIARNLAYQRPYYAITRRYAETALAGWRGDRQVSNRDFVIAAYQASQVYALTFEAGTWSAIVGADRVRSLDDPKLRRELSSVLYADYSPLRSTDLYTDYRRNVRRVIPLPIQEQIRAHCGDRVRPDNSSGSLPAACDLSINPATAAAAAAKLRAHPELADDLAYHFAVIAVALRTAKTRGDTVKALLDDIDRYVGRQAAHDTRS